VRNDVKLKKDQHSMQDRGSCGGGTYRHVVSWNFTDSDNIYTSLDQVWTMKLMHMVKIIITRIN